MQIVHSYVCLPDSNYRAQLHVLRALSDSFTYSQLPQHLIDLLALSLFECKLNLHTPDAHQMRIESTLIEFFFFFNKPSTVTKVLWTEIPVLL